MTDQIKTKGDIYEQNVAEIKSKKSKDQNFMEKGHSFLTAKGDEIKAKNKAIDSVSTGMKESVTKIKPASLADLPVEK